ncbi:hypothetical protein C8R48DRAFT_680517 [Suillus tomentosus]|nr:hypothetical protein C8R48DRAFT_680517 [Suillus tomentosus]
MYQIWPTRTPTVYGPLQFNLPDIPMHQMWESRTPADSHCVGGIVYDTLIPIVYMSVVFQDSHYEWWMAIISVVHPHGMMGVLDGHTHVHYWDECVINNAPHTVGVLDGHTHVHNGMIYVVRVRYSAKAISRDFSSRPVESDVAKLHSPMASRCPLAFKYGKSDILAATTYKLCRLHYLLGGYLYIAGKSPPEYGNGIHIRHNH